MSFRDLRNLSEILRTVGYPRLVSLENFRTPNFKLVADIGIWMVQQYEPKLDFPSSIENEQNRIIFARKFTEFMVTKVQVKLNTKRLYQADGYAVKELIKVALVLHNAMREAEKIDPGGGVGGNAGVSSLNSDEKNSVNLKLETLKQTRMLASDITQRGVALYDMLTKEMSLRDARQVALSRAFELSEVERLLRNAVANSESELKKLQSLTESTTGNMTNLDMKVEKKRQEIERSQKRLQTLKKVRPAFVEEYEKLQAELSIVYADYIKRFKSLSFLQKQMEDINRIEMERKAEERLEKQNELGNKGEDFFFLRNKKTDDLGSEDSEEEEDEEENQLVVPARPEFVPPPGKSHKSGRPGAGTASRQISQHPSGLSRQVYGSMLGAGDESGESESDLLLFEGENSDLDLDDDDIDLDNDEENQMSIELASQNGSGDILRKISKGMKLNGEIPLTATGRGGGGIGPYGDEENPMKPLTSGNTIMYGNGGLIANGRGGGGGGGGVRLNKSGSRNNNNNNNRLQPNDFPTSSASATKLRQLKKNLQQEEEDGF